jgi:hypothetical protein
VQIPDNFNDPLDDLKDYMLWENVY